jgi:hypothetical protein
MVIPMRLSSFRALRFSIGVGLFGLAALLAGCARPVGSVSGKVTFGDKVVKGGTVSFISEDGQPSPSAEIKEDGTYTITHITGGKYKVLVDTSSLKPAGAGGGYGMIAPGGAKTPPAKGSTKNSGPPAGADIPEGYKASNPFDASKAAHAAKSAKFYVAIPEKYSKPDQTDLVYEFPGGTQTFDIPLK